MASDAATEIFSGVLSGIKEGWQEARAEEIRRTTPIAYWSHLFDDFSYSPAEFYTLVNQHIQQRAVPDLTTEFVLLHEGTIFSRRRLYLELQRERFVFQLCAAPFGTGWFVSSRLFDRRRGATWWDFAIVAFIALWLTVAFFVLFGTLVAIALLGTVITFVWSLMRLAASQSTARLDDYICRIPCIGRIYETLFHPETYFRQDQRNMYKEAVHRALMAALQDLQSQKGLKPLSESEARPVLTELQRR